MLNINTFFQGHRNENNSIKIYSQDKDGKILKTLNSQIVCDYETIYLIAYKTMQNASSLRKCDVTLLMAVAVCLIIVVAIFLAQKGFCPCVFSHYCAIPPIIHSKKAALHMTVHLGS